MAKIKTKSCRVCHAKYQPMNSMAVACSPTCALTLHKAKQERVRSRTAASVRKERNARHKARREALKTRQDWMKEVQAEFNRFIRARDYDKPCVSCGRHHTGQYHAGHYRSVGSSPELRFNEINCHKQCQPCNNHLSGNIVNYRPALINRIGLPLVEWLESKHKPLKPTVDELKWLKQYYRTRAKEAQQYMELS